MSYYIKNFPGLCGMTIIYDVTFGNIREGMINTFYEEVQHHLRTYKYIGYKNRGNLMMSDAVCGESTPVYDELKKEKKLLNKVELGEPCIYSMCKYLGWDESKHRYNPRTGNKIVIFTTSREVTNGYNNYPRELDYNTGDFIV